MSYSAKIIKDSISRYGHRLTTFEITFPRIVLAELNTHRMLARNSASSRAIPVSKQLARIEEDPFLPIYWGKNQKGMQASEELQGVQQAYAIQQWMRAKDAVVGFVKNLLGVDVHKQIANRLLEPFMWHTVLVTATDLENFFALRANPEAQPEIRKIAQMMLEIYNGGSPILLNEGEWHLPLVDMEEIHEWRSNNPDSNNAAAYDFWRKICVGRCARVSYLTHDGKRDLQADLELYGRLVTSGHMSPLEHAARPMDETEYNNLFVQPVLQWDNEAQYWLDTGMKTHYLGNFNGWVQYRKMIKNEHNFALMKR